MGVDYVARKSAKKRKKKGRQEEGKDGKIRRERKRRGVRRLCTGVCWKLPVLTEEDKQWPEEDGELVSALMRSPRLHYMCVWTTVVVGVPCGRRPFPLPRQAPGL